MIGRRISGRYKLLDIIGDGGMAIVYCAKDLILDRDVAVKILRPEFSSDEEFIRRFKREAEAATSLDHPNIVNIFDVGEENNTYFIVMEYVKGKTLKGYIKEHGRLPVDEAIRIIKQIASAMAVAHRHGIIHRDIKPHNILIDEQGVAKVTDFGIALAITSATITHTNSVLGSVHYFSPEQARGGGATAKSDIYSLGIVLFEMLTGSVPFTGESPVSVALKHLQEEIPEPRVLNPEIPQSVENIILKALAKNPLQRYESADELLEDLDTALLPERVNENKWQSFDDEEDVTRVMTPISSPQANTTGAEVEKIEEQPDKPEKKPKKKKKKWWLIILLAVLLVGGSTVAAFTVFPSLFAVKEVTVPNVVNKPYEDAFDELAKHKFKVNRKIRYDDKVAQGHVISQSPGEGTSAKEGSSITLYVSRGFKKVDMLDVTGMNIDSAKKLLDENGYDTDNIEVVPVESEEVAKDNIISQKPKKGEKVNPSEDPIILRVSKGAPSIQLPNFYDQWQSRVKEYTDNNGLKVEFTYEYSDSVENGKVINQSPSPYTSVEKGSTIKVTISKGEDPEKKTKPDGKDKEITFNNKLKVEVSDEDKGKTFHVKIVYSDANATDSVFKEEDITETTEYMLPLTVKPDGEASYTVYLNDKKVASKTFDYEDVKKGKFKGKHGD